MRGWVWSAANAFGWRHEHRMKRRGGAAFGE